MNTVNYSQPDKCLFASGGLAELVDAYALGAYDFGHESSSLLSPTSKKTSEATLLGYKFVAQDVAFDKKCCSGNVKGVEGCGSNELGSLRINTHTPHTFSTAYSSSIATPLIVNQSICTSG